MDIELLKTFIEVTRTRHFSRAADNLFLTPAAVSARIRQLEQTLGVSLLHRIRGNIQMTPEGERLLPHAQQLVATWQQAREDVTLKAEQKQRLSLGATADLWRYFMKQQIGNIQRQLPTLALRLEAYSPPELIERLLAGQLDLIIIAEPNRQTGLTSSKIGQLSLTLVSTQPDTSVRDASISDYVHVDWGAAFDQFHAKRLGDRKAMVYTNQGGVALDVLQQVGGNAYLPESLLESEPQLFKVAGAPVFTRPLYACRRANAEESVGLQAVLSLLTDPPQTDASF